MKKKTIPFLLFLPFLTSLSLQLIGRHVYRPKDPEQPKIIVNWKNDPKKYTLEHNSLQEYPFTIFLYIFSCLFVP